MESDNVLAVLIPKKKTVLPQERVWKAPLWPLKFIRFRVPSIVMKVTKRLGDAREHELMERMFNWRKS